MTSSLRFGPLAIDGRIKRRLKQAQNNFIALRTQKSYRVGKIEKIVIWKLREPLERHQRAKRLR